MITRTNLSDKVSAWLVEAIEIGRFKTGERLPSVEQLAHELNVGNSSVREALRQLQALGRVDLKHGVGTFVSTPKLQLGSFLTSFSDAVRLRGMVPGSVVLQRDVITPTAQIRERLKLAPDEKVNYLLRLRLADSVPLAIENTYTSFKQFPDLLKGSWSLETSLYQLFQQKYGVQVYYAEQTISATLITAEQSQLLQVEKGSPGIAITNLTYDADGKPIEDSYDIYRGDRYQYTVTLVNQSR
jgi:GntR family transcriptional regulator